MKEDQTASQSQPVSDGLRPTTSGPEPSGPRSPWKTIKQFKGGDGERVTLWLSINPSPLSMGWADAFAVADCWRENGVWLHIFRGKPTELERRYITHWAATGADLKPGPRGAQLDWWTQ